MPAVPPIYIGVAFELNLIAHIKHNPLFTDTVDYK